MNERDVGEDRHRPIHGPVDAGLAGGIGQVIDATNDVRDAHVVIVGDNGQVIGRGGVAAQNDEVVQVCVLEDDITLDAISNGGFAVARHLQSDGR